MADTIELDADFAQDPNSLYDRLRTEAPVYPVMRPDGVRAWLVTRYADALALLNDPRLTTDASRALAQFEANRARPFDAAVFKNMLQSDPPEHTRLRRLVVKAFTSRAVERMQHHIEAIADELLDNIDCCDTTVPVDLVAGYAAPLPVRVICEMLGMPAHYADRFRAAFHPLVNIATHAAKVAAERDTIAVLNDVIEYKRQVPGDDLLTSLIGASSDGDRLSHPELVAMAFLLITGVTRRRCTSSPTAC